MAYINRKVEGVEDFVLLDAARSNMYNVLLQGPTGAAKTMVAQEYAKSRGIAYTKVSCSVSVDPTSLFGRYIPVDGGGFVWEDGSVTQALRGGEGVLILDEVNMMSPKISAGMFSLLDSNRSIVLLDHGSEIVFAKKGLLIVGTMNPNYAGTMRPNRAFVNRFPVILEWGYDSEVEKRLVKSPTLLKNVNNLRQAAGLVTVSSPLSTNMMMEFETLAKTVNIDVAIHSFCQHIDEDERAGVLALFYSTKGSILAELGENKKDKPITKKRRKLLDSGLTGNMEGEVW